MCLSFAKEPCLGYHEHTEKRANREVPLSALCWEPGCSSRDLFRHRLLSSPKVMLFRLLATEITQLTLNFYKSYYRVCMHLRISVFVQHSVCESHPWHTGGRFVSTAVAFPLYTFITVNFPVVKFIWVVLNFWLLINIPIHVFQGIYVCISV